MEVTRDNAQKFIDATLLAASCEYLNQHAIASASDRLQQIISKYKFTPDAEDTDKEFEQMLLLQRTKFKNQPEPDMQTKFFVRRFLNVAI